MTALRRLGVVMDPIGAISYAKDSTLAMLLAAQARGFALAYLEQRDLLLRDGVAFGRMRAPTVRADPASWFTLGEPARTVSARMRPKDPKSTRLNSSHRQNSYGRFCLEKKQK